MKTDTVKNRSKKCVKDICNQIIALVCLDNKMPYVRKNFRVENVKYNEDITYTLQGPTCLVDGYLRIIFNDKKTKYLAHLDKPPTHGLYGTTIYRLLGPETL